MPYGNTPKIPNTEVVRLTLDAIAQQIAKNSDLDSTGQACYGFEAEFEVNFTLVKRNDETFIPCSGRMKLEQGYDPGETPEPTLTEIISIWLEAHEEKEVDQAAVLELLQELATLPGEPVKTEAKATGRAAKGKGKRGDSQGS